MRGNAALSARHAAEAEALATRYGFRNVTLFLALDRGSKLLHSGDFTGAEAALRQYLAAATEAGAVQHQISALRYLSYTLLYAARYPEFAQSAAGAVTLSEAVGERWNRSELLGLRARAALENGDLSAANWYIDRAVTSLREEDLTAVSEVQNHLGLIRAAEGRDADAETALRRSLEVIADTEYNNLKIAVSLDLAKFLAQRGRFAEAQILYAEYARRTEQWGWHRWAAELEEIRRLIAAGQTA